jgi:phosphonate dehydrogenase
VSARPRILVTNRVHDEVVQRLAAVGDVSVNPSDEPFAWAELLRRAHDADAILAFMNDSVDAEFIAACPRLKIVACALKGADNFDAEACAAAGVWLSLVPDLLTEPTAELAVGLAIALGRELRAGDTLVRAGAFKGWRPILYGVGLDRSTVTIVGMGAVGRAIARRIAGFGSRILAVDPLAVFPSGVEGASLAPALAASDIVILAVPLSVSTRHMIGAGALAAIKPGALLVNVGRGSVVDETAVLAALQAGTLGGYAADVFEFEDWAWAGRPAEVAAALRTHPRTFFTPHLGSAVDRVRRDIAMRAADNIADVLTGRPARDAVNRPSASKLPMTG